MGEQCVVNPPPSWLLDMTGVLTTIVFSLLLLSVKPIKGALISGKKRWISEQTTVYPREGCYDYFANMLEPWIKLLDWIPFWFLVIGAVNATGHIFRCSFEQDFSGFYGAFFSLVCYSLFSGIFFLAEMCGIPCRKYTILMNIMRYSMRSRR